MKRQLSGTDRTLCALQELVRRYCAEAGPRVHVAPHGIDTSAADPSHRDADVREDRAGPTVRILFAGRFVDRKGIRDLLAAIPRVLAASHAARFILAGGQRGASAEEVAAWWNPDPAGWRDRVSFTGWVSAEAVPHLYRTADILVVPSWYEPFGMVVLEAMVYGLAIAAADVGGPAEILEHRRTALLFTPRDPDAIARTLIELTSDAALRSRLGRLGAIEVRSRWTWDARLPAVQAAYAAAIAARRAA